MKLVPAPGSRLQHRIVLFFVVLLMAVQLASFLAIRFAIQRTAQDSMREEMRVGARVFKRLLEQNSQQLVEATSVLTYDFGFREAIATRDRDTIVSALRNHGARIKASGMSVVGLDGIFLADTHVEANAGKPYPNPDLIETAASLGRSAGVRLMVGKPYQLVVVPVLAPRPIAWVSMMFVIDDNTARDLQRLSSSDVTFVRAGRDPPELLATTLPPSRRSAMVEVASKVVRDGGNGISTRLGEDEFEMLATPIGDTGPDLKLYALLQRSVAEGHAPYLALQAVLMFLAAVALAITLLGAIRIARRITRPVTELAGAAREIAAGNYAVKVHAAGDDELGDLARSFDGMVKRLAERDSLRDALGKVASNDVVEKFLQGEIELGGEERDVTVMFTDVRNFTGLAESLSPQQSLSLLNEFLTAISEVVEEHGGVVDKYLGDGVMAIFGAPVTRPDDPQRAVDCALRISTRVEALGPALAARGLPHPQVGLGMNTARVIAGNMGSPTRLNYTVLGDGVNLASRLEGLTKRYHVPIVAGSRTRESVTGIVWRELDKVRVKGKTVPERIFEPLGHVGEVPAAMLADLARWHEALDDFRSRRWARARAGLETLADEPTYLRLVAIYLGYLRELAADPPGEEWDAAFTLYDK